MFSANIGFWLYNNRKSEFGVRDLGYYIGYAICQRYYVNPNDKKQAIKTMIELNYNDEKALNNFVDQSGYFEQPVTTIGAHYENERQ
jgi:hypothetical protein